MSQDKATVNSLGGPIKWVGWSLGDLKDGANHVSPIDRDSDMASACQLCVYVGGGLRKATVASGSLCTTGTFQSATPVVLELRVRESE